MKFTTHLLLLLGVLLSALTFGACSDEEKPLDEVPEPPFLTLEAIETTLTDIEVDGKTFLGTVTSNRKVTVLSSEKWCTAELSTDTEKDNLRLTVLPNPDQKERTAIVTISAPECKSKEITLTQVARNAEPFLAVSMDELPDVDAAGGKFMATVTTNRSGVKVTSSKIWCEVSYNPTLETDNITLNILPNTDAGPRTATVTVSASECESKQIVVIQLKTLGTDCELLTFDVTKAKNPALTGDLAFTFDKKTRTLKAIYLKWIEGNTPEMMIPTFTFKGEKVLVGGETVTSGETKISLANAVTMEVVAENGDKTAYTITLNCPQINTEAAVLHMKPATEIVDRENYVNTQIELFDKTAGATGEGWWNTAENGKTIEMRGRGNSTWGLPKKPFRMKFPEKFSPLGLNHAKEKSWVLLSQDMDKSMIRTNIAFEYSRILFNRAEDYHDEAAVLFTTSTTYVNVYFTGTYYDSSTGRREQKTGDYQGLYLMCDQMERATGRIEVDKLNASSSIDDIEGGYIIETDIHEGNYYSKLKNVKMSYKYPKDDDCSPAQIQYITNIINEAERVLYSADYKNPTMGWRKYFDEKTLADFIIIKELAGDMDGFTSTYMYKRRGNEKLFFGPIWDCDKGWDNDKRVPHFQYQPLSSLMIHAGFWMPSYVENDWFWRFWDDETFRSFVAARWAAKKADLIAKTNEVIDHLPAAMAKSIEANFEVWPFYYQYSEEAKMPARTYAEEIERMRTLTGQRAALLDKLFNK